MHMLMRHMQNPTQLTVAQDLEGGGYRNSRISETPKTTLGCNQHSYVSMYADIPLKFRKMQISVCQRLTCGCMDLWFFWRAPSNTIKMMPQRLARFLPIPALQGRTSAAEVWTMPPADPLKVAAAKAWGLLSCSASLQNSLSLSFP